MKGKEVVRAFLHYSEGERRGIVVLLALMITVAGLRFYTALYPPKHPVNDPYFTCEVEAFIAKSIKPQKATLAYEKYNKGKEEPFPFDPNTISRKEGKALGLSGFAISNLLKYRASGGVFEIKRDLKKVYGITEADMRRLDRFIELPDKREKIIRTVNESVKSTPLSIIDMNRADTLQWRALNGIGKVLSRRIVKYRDRLGGFVRKEQLLEVYGINDSLYDRLTNQLNISDGPLVQMNINQVDARALMAHPYVKDWDEANAIVRYRKTNGMYTDLAILYQLHVLDSTLVKKITPYLTLK